MNVWPGEVPSDLDVDEENRDHLVGRWSILLDLYADFQGACGAYLLVAFLIPGLMVVSVVFEWTERPDVTLAIAAVVFTACISISLYSYIWFRWAKKRVNKVRALMDRIDDED